MTPHLTDISLATLGLIAVLLVCGYLDQQDADRLAALESNQAHVAKLQQAEALAEAKLHAVLAAQANEMPADAEMSK